MSSATASASASASASGNAAVGIGKGPGGFDGVVMMGSVVCAGAVGMVALLL